MRRAFGCLIFLLAVVALALWGRDYILKHPQDVPWTALDLKHPVGRFTGKKLAALAGEPDRCRALLTAAGSIYERAPARSEGTQCGYSNAFRLNGAAPGFVPTTPVTACPVAAAMVVFEEQVLQTAAIEHFEERISRISHAGSYSCRRLYGRAEGAFSEHATANAIDLTGFTLESGRTISVQKDWASNGSAGAFLRDVRDGACGLFSTVLSPDYNQAHADHLHLDQANRGPGGWRMCR